MSAALVAIAYEYGRLAFERGARRVPALDPNVGRLLQKGARVGSASEMLAAWLKGWDDSNLRRVAEVAR